MRRKIFDALATFGGLAITVVLIVAGGLLVWGHSVVTNDVHNQLAAQKIVFPAANSPEIKALPKADATAMTKYAGQLMTTGAQAETWADHFIAVHLIGIGGGKTYSQLSAEAMALPPTSKKYAVLEAQVNTVFRGETLRGLLLNAYGFWQIGQIMLIAAWVAFVAAAVMLLLSIFGFVHLYRVAPEAEVMPKLARRGTKVQTA
jgi:hypothetical protein